MGGNSTDRNGYSSESEFQDVMTDRDLLKRTQNAHWNGYNISICLKPLFSIPLNTFTSSMASHSLPFFFDGMCHTVTWSILFDKLTSSEFHKPHKLKEERGSFVWYGKSIRLITLWVISLKRFGHATAWVGTGWDGSYLRIRKLSSFC